MPNVLVTGAQWGDEGKGKIVDLLASRADFSVRFGGGANAGHTLVVGDRKLVLHLVPAGMLHGRCRGLVGNGCVVEPEGLLGEISELSAAGIDVAPGRLVVSPGVHVVTAYHKIEDRLRGGAIGTTGRGIGPAYTDKVRRTGVRLGDIVEGRHEALVEAQHDFYRAVLGALHGPTELPSPAEVAEGLSAAVARLAPYVGDVASILHQAVRAGANVVFEGAQGAMLDVDHGTYPFVTSSTTTAGGASSGVGVYVELGRRIAVMKAYTTRVGNGPFPTELKDEIGERIRAEGREFGATTGRPRRCGWLDLPALRHAFRVNGITDIALTKLDVLQGFEAIRVAVEHGAGSPVYRDFEGFREPIAGAKALSDLPSQVRTYLAFLEESLDTPIALLSLGAERDATLVLRELLPT